MPRNTVALLRQSLVETADNCLREAWYDLTAWLPGTSDAAAIGTGYHGGLEYYYAMRRDHPTTALYELHDEYMINEYVDAGLQAFHEEIERAGDAMRWNDHTQDEAEEIIEHLIRTYFSEGHYWPDVSSDGGTYRVEAVELKLDAPRPDWLPPGWAPSMTVDLLLSWTPPGGSHPTHWILVDHKTSGKRWAERKATARENFQAMWYLIHVADHLGITHAEMSAYFDVMRRDGQAFQRLQTVVTESDIHRAKVKAQRVALVLDQTFDLPGGPAGNPKSNFCSDKYCNYWDVCPWGAGTTSETLVTF